MVGSLKGKDSDTETWSRFIWAYIHVILGLPDSPEMSRLVQVVHSSLLKDRASPTLDRRVCKSLK